MWSDDSFMVMPSGITTQEFIVTNHSHKVRLVEEKEGEVSIFKTPNGTLRLWRPAPHVVASRMVGRLGAGLEEPFMQQVDSIIDQGYKYAVYHDWSEMTGYDSFVRQRLTSWTSMQQAAGQLKSIDILVRARVVAMGVQVASMILGGAIKSHTSLHEFQSALERECKADPTSWQ